MNCVELPQKFCRLNKNEVARSLFRADKYKYPIIGSRSHNLLTFQRKPTTNAQRILKHCFHVRCKEITGEFDLERDCLFVPAIRYEQIDARVLRWDPNVDAFEGRL